MHLSGLELLVFAVSTISSVLGASTSSSSVHTDSHAVTCQSFGISWVGGTPPYTLELQNVAAPNPPISTTTQGATTYVWTPDVPAGTTVRLLLSDSSGTLSQNSTFNVQAGTDTSCVVQPNSNSSAATANSTGRASFTSSGSLAAAVNTSPPIATGISKAPSGNSVLIAAIVVPIVLVIVLVLLFLFARLRKSRRQEQGTKSIFEDPENVPAQDSRPVSLNIDPFASPVDTMPIRPLTLLEKSLPVHPPRQPQVTPEELQDAIDRVQEMYGIIREMQNSTTNAGAGANERVAELQRQIQDLMADNAVLSGEQPPSYSGRSGSSYSSSEPSSA